MALLSETQLQQVADAVAAVEQRTDAELVTVLALRADDYRFVPTLWAAIIALLVPGVLRLTPFWLDLVEEFQARFLSHLDEGAPVAAGLAAVAFVCRWVRRHPREARLMLVHRREDFAADRRAAPHRRRAQQLFTASDTALRRYALRLCGRAGAGELRIVRFALVDLPTAALRRDVEAGAPAAKRMETILLDTCAHALRAARGT